MDTSSNRQPIFNAPSIIVSLIAVILAIHAGREWFLDAGNAQWVLLVFAFVPGFITAPAELLPTPYLKYWSPLSYALLHGDWLHVGLNSFYLLAFGTPVAQRFGGSRFLCLMAAGALGGSLAHYIVYTGQLVPMIGASAAVSAALGAACRFILVPGRSIQAQIMAPARTLLGALTERSVLVFVGIWFAINWFFGAGILAVPGQSAAVAWQAHMGGFAVGFIGFALFDPVPRNQAP